MKKILSTFWTACRQSYQSIGIDRLATWSAAISYYAILSVIPLCVGVVTVASYFADREWILNQLSNSLREFAPQGVSFLSQLVASALDQRQSAGIISLVIILYSGGRVFGTLAQALNDIFDTGEHRSFLGRLLTQTVMTLSLGSVFIVAITAPALLDLVGWALGYLPLGDQLTIVVRWLVTPVLFVAIFFCLYRFLPQGKKSSAGAFAGAIAASICFIAARPIFSYYIQEFASFSSLYGPFAVAITLILWTSISAFIVLLGAEIALHFHLLYVTPAGERSIEKLHKEKAKNLAESSTIGIPSI